MIQHVVCNTWFATHQEVTDHIQNQQCPAIDYHEALYKVKTIDVDGMRVFAGGPRGMEAKRRKIRKELKKKVARAKRIAKEGISWEDVACPVCYAPLKRRSYSSDYHCTTNGRDPRPHYAPHRDRLQAAQDEFRRIILAGREAREKLEQMDQEDQL